MPPAPVTGVKAVAAWFCARVDVATACVAVTALLMVRLKVLLAVALLASVTVTVYVVAEEVTDGLPVTAPVLVLKLSPMGSEGEMP